MNQLAHALPSRRMTRRRGAMMVFALLALVVSSMIGASLVRTALMTYQQLQAEQHKMQAEWLADAGCQRAIRRKNADPNFEAEDWTVPAARIVGAYDGQVHIQFENGDGNSGQTISVIAIYPVNAAKQVKVRKQLRIHPRP